ncbi:MAG: cysteine synthase CysM [Thiohalorhabdus sp.]|uniref:cysteine synthase CysM n=1 Tax=Thiohalorhabdus sp. TaxID=3094134 RepID=UPI00397EFC10
MARLEELVGNTPLCELRRIGPRDKPVRLLLKLEGNNPAGSVKDRPALSMILGAEERGELAPGSRIIEPTSGNTGIALAMVAAVRGYEITLVMPESASEERKMLMRAYGARLELTPADQGMEGTIDRAREMIEADPGAVMLDQFANPDNPRAHYEATAPEIWRDTQGRVTHFVSSMGTTGTIMGCSQYFREEAPQVEVVGAQPSEGSRIPGIRAWPEAYLPRIYDRSQVDRIVGVDQSAAEDMARRLAREEGLFLGLSAGGAVVAMLEVAEALDEGVVVGIAPDRGDRYLSTGLYA